MGTYEIIQLLLAPATGAAAWFASKPKRKSEAVEQMQRTIDLLFAKNQELYEKNLKLQDELMKTLERLGECQYTIKGFDVMAAK
jgi:hypothetical protein